MTDEITLYDWKDDSAICVDSLTGKPDERLLRDKTLHEVLTQIGKGDKSIFPYYYNDTVSENYAVIDGIQKLFEYLRGHYGVESYNLVLRGVVIHGFEIYKYRIGHRIAQSFDDTPQLILTRNRRILGGDTCNVNLDECGGKNSTFYLDEKISAAIGQHSRKGCIPKNKLATLCMCYSLSTYPDITGWQDIIQSNIRKFEKAQRERMGIE